MGWRQLASLQESFILTSGLAGWSVREGYCPGLVQGGRGRVWLGLRALTKASHITTRSLSAHLKVGVVRAPSRTVLRVSFADTGLHLEWVLSI